ncbi:MAG TPA: serine/threonine-protein kinase [Kofleriaceae bacterium]
MAVDPPVEDDTAIDQEPSHELSRQTTGATLPLISDGPPAPAQLALVAAGRLGTPPSATPSISLTSAADALRNEEIERTRLFIIMGWAISVVAIGTVPFVDAPPVTAALLVGGLVAGMLISFVFYRRFADPQKYTERALLGLAMLCVVNGHIAVLFYGPFTAAPMLVVVGIHFVARTELERVARWVLVSATACYSAIAAAMIAGVPDPGTFAPDRQFGSGELALATGFVLAAYGFAYYAARMFRVASLTSIDELQRATRLASQREALMEELRADLERALQVGGPGRYTEQLIGAYRLGIVLGRGAIGEVYDATNVLTEEQAAIKLLRREMLADQTQIARFLREVRASAALSSPHVVRVFATGGEQEAVPYLAMERLHGQTLAELLRREPKLSPENVLELVRQVGIGIDAAREAGIVHRDLKPANLFFTTHRVWKILDFGVASLSDDAGMLTQGDVVGTPHYMAPEQAQGHKVDYRADLYALATIAYRCLTGRYPFTAADTPALLYAVVHRMPARPSAIADLPNSVDRWCALAMAKEPGARFTSGSELADSLDAALRDELDPKLRKRADALIRKHPWELA